MKNELISSFPHLFTSFVAFKLKATVVYREAVNLEGTAGDAA